MNTISINLGRKGESHWRQLQHIIYIYMIVNYRGARTPSINVLLQLKLHPTSLNRRRRHPSAVFVLFMKRPLSSLGSSTFFFLPFPLLLFFFFFFLNFLFQFFYFIFASLSLPLYTYYICLLNFFSPTS